MFWVIEKVQYNQGTGSMSGPIRKKKRKGRDQPEIPSSAAGGHHPQIVSQETGLHQDFWQSSNKFHSDPCFLSTKGCKGFLIQCTLPLVNNILREGDGLGIETYLVYIQVFLFSSQKETYLKKTMLLYNFNFPSNVLFTEHIIDK